MGSKTVTTNTPSNKDLLSKVIKKSQYSEHTHQVTVPTTEYQIRKKSAAGYKVTSTVGQTGVKGFGFTYTATAGNNTTKVVAQCHGYDYVGGGYFSGATSQSWTLLNDRKWDFWYQGTAYYNPNSTISIGAYSGRDATGINYVQISVWQDNNYIATDDYKLFEK